MWININYLTIISSATGKESEEIYLEKSTTIAELIGFLSDKYGPRFKDIVYMNSKDRKYMVSFWVNNATKDDDSYTLENGDELTIVLALGGG